MRFPENSPQDGGCACGPGSKRAGSASTSGRQQEGEEAIRRGGEADGPGEGTVDLIDINMRGDNMDPGIMDGGRGCDGFGEEETGWA